MRINESKHSTDTSKIDKKKSPMSPISEWIGGILFTLLIASLGYGLALIPGLDRVGQMAFAILIAVIYRQLLGYPEKLRSGIQFSSKRLLRVAIIMYGLKLNMDLVFREGLSLLAQDAVVIILSIVVMLLIAKWFKAERSLSLLLAIGTGVCGAAAIAAVSPILKTKDEDTALGVGIIALVGTMFAVVYTALRPLLPISAIPYGVWSGVSLHELAHVALAASPAGEDSLAIALMAKLGRVFLLVPLCFILMYWMKRKGTDNTHTKIEFPWFLIGFLIMSVFGSYVLDVYIPVSTTFMDYVSQLTTFILTMAMTGLGLNVHLNDVRTKALRPLLAMVTTSFLLSVATFLFNH